MAANSGRHATLRERETLFVGSARPPVHPAVIRLGTHIVTADHGLLSLPEIDLRSLRQSRGRLKAATQSLGRCCGATTKA